MIEKKRSIEYPVGAVEFLRQNLPDGRIFSHYNWGGYLIWKLPEKKVFIDGRMPSWRWKKGLPGESEDAMGEFLEILTEEGKFKEAIEKYQIKTVLWETPKRLVEGRTSLEEKWLFWKSKVVVVHNLLIKEGWRVVYQDEVATVYQK